MASRADIAFTYIKSSVSCCSACPDTLLDIIKWTSGMHSLMTTLLKAADLLIKWKIQNFTLTQFPYMMNQLMGITHQEACHFTHLPTPLSTFYPSKPPCMIPSYLKPLQGSISLPLQQVMWAFPWSPPLRVIFYRDNPTSRISQKEYHVSIQSELAFIDYIGIRP